VRPILIQIGELAIPSYGIMLVISFLMALWFAKRHAKNFNISPIIIENLAFYLMLGVIIGGRMLYVISHWSQYENHLLDIFAIWKGGMMFFGGFVGGFIAGMLYLKKEKLSVLQVTDIVAPAIALGHFFTRIGCFLNGCCFGKPSNLPWAVKFPENCVAGNQFNVPLHPTQIYSSLFGLALFFFLGKRLLSQHRTGEVFSLYLIFYGGFRFGIDFIRYYEDRANFWINQLIAIGLIVVGMIIYLRSSSKYTAKN
jgi:phosphatidylglycerol:prolipoprotein diacylglycerol transferase